MKGKIGKLISQPKVQYFLLAAALAIIIWRIVKAVHNDGFDGGDLNDKIDEIGNPQTFTQEVYYGDADQLYLELGLELNMFERVLFWPQKQNTLLISSSDILSILSVYDSYNFDILAAVFYKKYALNLRSFLRKDMDKKHIKELNFAL